jgi:hypothetical protein
VVPFDSGTARSTRMRVDRLTLMAAWRASRAPARPASANAIAANSSTSWRLRRPCLTVSPGSCSQKICRAQSSVWQTNRRTRRWINTCCPVTGASASRRSYQLCTRSEAVPHAGHGASSASAHARMQTTPSSCDRPSTRRAARCGNRTLSSFASHTGGMVVAGARLLLRHQKCARTVFPLTSTFGKTTLAAEVCRRLKDRFPDGTVQYKVQLASRCPPPDLLCSTVSGGPISTSDPHATFVAHRKLHAELAFVKPRYLRAGVQS